MKKLTFLLLIFATTLALHAQVAINKDASNPTSTSILHVKGDVNDKNIILEPGAGGGVSIGTTDSPSHKLTIQSEDDNKALRLIGTGDLGVGAQLNFGDGNYTYIKEEGDDSLTIYSLQRTSIMGGNVGVGTKTPDASAALEVSSTSKGFLPPRMSTTEMNAIFLPPAGLMIFNTTVNSICYYDGSTWNNLNNIDDKSSGDITYEGQTYQTVIIGTQCWMAENLNVGAMINSITGGTYSNGEQTDNGTIEKYCYDDNTNNCNTYGGLYQWNEMMQYVTTEGTQGICPPGWHIPTEAEWQILEMHLGMTQAEAGNVDWRGTHNEGGKLKETGLTHWNNPNTGATNSSGFTALPGGNLRYSEGLFYYLGQYGYWWSSSIESSGNMWYRFLEDNYNQVGRISGNEAAGLSVRCLKD